MLGSLSWTTRRDVICVPGPKRLRCESFACTFRYLRRPRRRLSASKCCEAARLPERTSALQELEETVYWLELLIEAEIVSEMKSHDLIQEAGELISIFVSSAKTAKLNR